MEPLSRHEESQSLLSSSFASTVQTSHTLQSDHKCLKHICLPSKAAIILVCLAVVIGALHAVFVCVFVFIAVILVGGQYIPESVAIFTSYLVMAVTVFLYPLSGFIADVKYGRFRVMVASMCFIVISLLFMSGAISIYLVHPYTRIPFPWSNAKTGLFFVLVVLYGMLFGAGLICYYANFVQFGLDQLLEAPSEYLSLFIHWLVWADKLAYVVVMPVVGTVFCRSATAVALASCIPIVCFFLLIILLIIIFCNRRWFYTEPGQGNPYKSVTKVLAFAWKHKYPLQRSAFTYCDDEIPSRLDFCKEKFGGPFSTEQVENVKTLIQISIILLTIGPVFVLYILSELLGLPLIGTHIAHKGNRFCNIEFILLEGGGLKYIASTVAFPVYITVMFSCLKLKRPAMFTRIGTGIFLCLAGVLSIIITDVIGHAQADIKANASNSLCMLSISFQVVNSTLVVPSLRMHWASLIPVNVFFGIGPLLIFTTSFEFIAAQSPHSMKGLIVGLLFTIKGFFQLLSSFALLPFTLKKFWHSKHILEHPPVTNCGFGFFLFILVVATIGFILFSVAAKHYKYRERDDRPFDHRFATDFYECAIENRERDNS